MLRKRKNKMLAKINFKIMAKTTKFILLSKSPWHKNGENQRDKKSHTWAPFSGISVVHVS
jgi:hypothetical protein